MLTPLFLSLSLSLSGPVEDFEHNNSSGSGEEAGVHVTEPKIVEVDGEGGEDGEAASESGGVAAGAST